MEKLITTKNPKSANFMINNPFLAVMVGEEKIGYFVQCVEKSYNSHGGVNYWDIIYYIPVGDNRYMWAQKDDKYVVLYNSREIINRSKTIFSGKRDGIEDEFILIKDGSEICNNFLLVKDLGRDDYKYIFQFLKDGHFWDGKPSKMFLKGMEVSEKGYNYLSYISNEDQSRFALHCGKNVYSLWKEGEYDGMVQLDESDHWITEYNFWEDADQKLAEEPEEAPAEEYVDVETCPRRRRRRSE